MVEQGGTLITNAPYSPETMSMVTKAMLIHVGVAESFREEATL